MNEATPSDFSLVTQAAIQDEIDKQPDDGNKTLTEADFRKIRKVYFTQQYGKVSVCGHSFHPLNEPQHRNCQPCWFAYFNTHGELTKAIEEFFRTHREAGLTQVRGQKFTKMFLKFMSTLAQLQEMNESSNTGAIGDNSGTDGGDGAGENNSSEGRSGESTDSTDSPAVQV